MTKKKLNLGCGTDIREGWINLDNFDDKRIDVKHDLETFPYPFEDNYFDEIIAVNVLEHIENPVRVIEELHRITAKNGKVTIRVPYYNSKDMGTDPTHKNFFSEHSLDYFDPSKKHCQERPYYSTARFSINKTSAFTNILSLKYVQISSNVLKAPLFYIAGLIGNVVSVIEFELICQK
ncbi:MAG: class I SAM-dependent methyltransferase [Flavobacteriales bacterium]|nr:class I SAM-dependent methyltransferase [Flavobacteriales bacterium]MCB9173367.1 class I SAM-dependent methyltransferase [Flavobacteriales bacterium]